MLSDRTMSRGPPKNVECLQLNNVQFPYYLTDVFEWGVSIGTHVVGHPDNVGLSQIVSAYHLSLSVGTLMSTSAVVETRASTGH